jgi:site-specific DNA-methyltransferase (adenine-specific)
MNLIQGDSSEKLKEIESESIDLILTSPPYDDLRHYSSLPFEKFKIIAKECFRVLKNDSVMVWVVGDGTVDGSESLTSFKQAIYFKEVIGFNLYDTMIYAAEKPPLTHRRYNPKFEYMFVLSKGIPKTFNPILETTKYGGIMKNNRRYRGEGDELKAWHKQGIVKETKVRGNIWEYSIGWGKTASNPIAYEHPAIFPEALAEDHIKSWTNPMDIVLDPFLGSGTVGVACQRLDREFIGIELDEKFFELAKRRILSTNRQMAFSI